MFMIMSMMINFLFIINNKPLMLGKLLFLQTLILTMMMGKTYHSFWFSYIMFLMFIGGLFILFMYIISLNYTMKFYFNFNILYMILMFMMTIMMINKNYFFFNHEMEAFAFKIIMKENYINSLKFYNFPNNLINLMLISYLFLLMTIVVKITNFYTGPLRNN